ncbi:class I SAM-dependent methyltransferase [Leptolyngbya sp. CCNP1308]|uniref:class I SAM-dependent methyltransferase n=1 Tax=Leptolyngbya sp. CCNP1308 TaxID=3110255 RepID=UPI002B1FD282|nr:class I SAM-dependent methyltransferase [Leptolyngbya sp. CCNP1308]MEA5452267.1 class I SAM-dependent methyltransferase [Leptolyngbya sp. CCNP1308]
MSKPLSPLTKRSDVSFVESTSTKQLIDDWQQKFSIDISSHFASCSQIDLYQCKKTELQFFVPENIEGSSRLYEQLQSFDWYYMPDKWEHRVALNDLNNCSNVLEIGSAFGDFLQKAIDHGLNVQGIELNQEAIKAAQNRALPIDSLDLNALAKTHKEHFDGVCSFQVLEHVAQPGEFIQASLDILKPGGKLIYCVPNSKSFLHHQYNILDMPPHHVTRWSENTFRALENLFPIKLEVLRFEPLAIYHISSFLGAYSNYFKSISPLYKIPFNRLSLSMYHKVLTLGMRRFFRGQSLYARFRKLT